MLFVVSTSTASSPANSTANWCSYRIRPCTASCLSPTTALDLSYFLVDSPFVCCACYDVTYSSSESGTAWQWPALDCDVAYREHSTSSEHCSHAWCYIDQMSDLQILHFLQDNEEECEAVWRASGPKQRSTSAHSQGILTDARSWGNYYFYNSISPMYWLIRSLDPYVLSWPFL